MRAAAAAAALLAGCGSSSSGGEIKVSAAASLTKALTACSGKEVKLSFAGSDELAAQIRQGVKPDVFASANTKLPDALAAEGRLEKPVVFATNELVIASRDGVGLDGLTRPGVKIAIGSKGVPVGSYTRDVLGRLPGAQRKAILANVRSEEPDVKGVLGKLTQGAVDAGFVYASDIKAANEKLRATALPASLKPTVEYGAGAVKGAGHPGAAKTYLDGLTSGMCAEELRRDGFGPPPR